MLLDMRRLLLALLLLCCAHRRWVKSGSSHAEFKADSYGCERDARAVISDWKGRAHTEFDDDFFVDCMEGHGWKLVE